MTNEKLACEGCAREIPTLALWTALSLGARLKCSNCSKQVTHEYLSLQAERSEYAKAVLVAYTLLVRFGWTSADAIENAGVQLDPRVLGGILTGMQRGGLIQRIGPAPKNPLLFNLVEPKIQFEPGPRFPRPRPDLAAGIQRRPATHQHPSGARAAFVAKT